MQCVRIENIFQLLWRLQDNCPFRALLLLHSLHPLSAILWTPGRLLRVTTSTTATTTGTTLLLLACDGRRDVLVRMLAPHVLQDGRVAVPLEAEGALHVHSPLLAARRARREECGRIALPAALRFVPPGQLLLLLLLTRSLGHISLTLSRGAQQLYANFDGNHWKFDLLIVS